MKTVGDFLKDIEQAKLTWIAIKDAPAMFEAAFAGEYIKLRLNDFPDEPLYTVFIRNEPIDIEERPRGWHLQHNR